MLIKTMSCLLSQANLPAFSNQFTTIYPHNLICLFFMRHMGDMKYSNLQTKFSEFFSYL